MANKIPWDSSKDSITSVVIERGITTIAESAFAYCTALESVTLPESLTTIGYWVFDGCTALENVTIPAGVSTINTGAFANCTALKSVTIPKSVTTIGTEAFLYCEALKEIIIPCDFDKTIFGTLTYIGPKGDQFILLSSYDNVEGSFVYKHDLSYSANGATITVRCDSEACAKSNPSATLTLVAPTNLTYDGQAKAATLTGLSDFNTLTGLSVAENSIKYFAATKSGNTYTKGGSALDGAPTNAGDYIAEITVKDSTASVGYTIAKDSTKAKPETPVEQKPTETTPIATQTSAAIEKGIEVTVEKKGTFEVTSDATSKTNTVTYTAVANTKAKSVTIPDTVTVDGKKYEVTEVSAEALKNSSATTVTIGKNVTTLAPEAFKGSNVKTITIKSKKLTKQSVKNAFKGLKVKKLIVKVKVGSIK